MTRKVQCLALGKELDALAYNGVLDDTIVIFTSDNGGDVGGVEEALAREKGFENNGDFRGDKHTIWEGGFRVPFVVRWPGQVKAGSNSDRMINVADIFATLTNSRSAADALRSSRMRTS